jgi:LmbE family N-acetylglucosaminyl deacetylase
MREGNMTSDARRFRAIEVRKAGSHCYHICIDDQLWSEVEWSPSRERWCVQDAEGRCLAHVDVFSQTIDTRLGKDDAITLAKEMIRDGRMPTPEEACASYQARELEDATKSRRALFAGVARRTEDEPIGRSRQVSLQDEPMPLLDDRSSRLVPVPRRVAKPED